MQLLAVILGFGGWNFAGHNEPYYSLFAITIGSERKSKIFKHLNMHISKNIWNYYLIFPFLHKIYDFNKV
jgi:hypothetical protein